MPVLPIRVQAPDKDPVVEWFRVVMSFVNEVLSGDSGYGLVFWNQSKDRIKSADHVAGEGWALAAAQCQDWQIRGPFIVFLVLLRRSAALAAGPAGADRGWSG